MDKTGLFLWKALKEWLMLLLTGNLFRDFKLKPLLGTRSVNLMALYHVIKASLPVIWKSNAKVWAAIAVFEDCRFFPPFCPGGCTLLLG